MSFQISYILFSFYILFSDVVLNSNIVNSIKIIVYLDHVNDRKTLKSRVIMESYLGKKSQKDNSEDKKDEDVKSDSESELGCTATAANLLCTTHQIQDLEEGDSRIISDHIYLYLSISEIKNSSSQLIKCIENTTETIAVIPDVLELWMLLI